MNMNSPFSAPDRTPAREHTACVTVFLIGMRCSGKSTVGRLIAQRAGCSFTDTDALVETLGGGTVAAIVAARGWPAFRELEALALREASAKGVGDQLFLEGHGSAVAAPSSAPFSGCHAAKARPVGNVVATGGGIVLLERNITFMRENGRVFYLQAPVECLAGRMREKGNSLSRPTLTGAEPAEELAAVLTEREPLYRAAAHFVVDAAAPLEAVAAEVCAQLEREKEE